jgi:hypothetical protein
VNQVRVLLASESVSEGDAIARYLRSVPWVHVVAEVTDLAALHALHPLPAVDVVLINDRLPGNARPDETLRALSVSAAPARLVRITTTLGGLVSPVPVAATLSGEFGPRELLAALQGAVGFTPVVAVGGWLPGSGVTSVVLLVAYAALQRFPHGQILLRDLSERPLLPGLLGRHPLLRHPRFASDGEGVIAVVDLGASAAPPPECTCLLAVRPTGLRALSTSLTDERFGRAPDRTLPFPQPSPILTGAPPPRGALVPYLRLLDSCLPKGRDPRGAPRHS